MLVCSCVYTMAVTHMQRTKRGRGGAGGTLHASRRRGGCCPTATRGFSLLRHSIRMRIVQINMKELGTQAFSCLLFAYAFCSAPIPFPPNTHTYPHLLPPSPIRWQVFGSGASIRKAVCKSLTALSQYCPARTIRRRNV